MAKKTNSKALQVGLGIAAVSAMALGAYMLSGDKGAKNRKIVKGWMLKAKGEVLEQVEKAKEVSLDAYDAAVKTVAEKYSKMSGVTPADIKTFVNELRNSGKMIASKSKSATKKSSKKVKSAAKKKK